MILTGTILIGIELLRSVPAWLRVRQSKRTDGISAMSTGVLAGTSPGWIAVAILAGSPGAALANTIWLVFHLLLLHEVVRAGPGTARTIGRATALGFLGVVVAGAVGAAVGDPASALGIAIGIAAAAYTIPALVRGMRSPSTAGLSLVSLSTNTVEGSIYLVAGAGLGGIAPAGTPIAAYLLFGGLAVLSNLPRLVRVAWRRARGLDLPCEQQRGAVE